jgi:hypothetical protein
LVPLCATVQFAVEAPVRSPPRVTVKANAFDPEEPSMASAEAPAATETVGVPDGGGGGVTAPAAIRSPTSSRPPVIVLPASEAVDSAVPRIAARISAADAPGCEAA